MNNNNIQYHQIFREGGVYDNKTITNPELIGLLNRDNPPQDEEQLVNTVPNIARVRIFGGRTKHIYLYSRQDALPDPEADDHVGYIIVSKRVI